MIRKLHKRIVEHVRADRLIRGSVTLGRGVLISQVLTLATMPIITRLYSTADYGILAIYASIVGVAASATSLRYEIALPGIRDREEAIRLIRLLLALVAIFMLIAGAIVAMFGPGLMITFELTNEHWYILALIPIGLGAIGVYQIMSYWTLRDRAYDILAKTRVMQGGSRVLLHLLGWIVMPKPAALVVGEITGRAVGITKLSGSLKSSDLRGQWKWNDLSTIAMRYKRFPIYVLPSALLTTGIHQIMPIYIGFRYDMAMVGIFALCYRLLQVPIEFLNSTTGQAYFAEGSRIRGENPILLRHLFTSTVKKLFVISIPPAVVMAIGGPFLFGLIFGPQWHQSGVFMSLLVPVFITQSIANPISQSLVFVEKENVILIVDIIRMLIVASALFVSYIHNVDIIVSVIIYSASMSVSFMFGVAVNYFYLKSVYA